MTLFQEDSRQVTREELPTKGSKPYSYVTQYRALSAISSASSRANEARGLSTSSGICTLSRLFHWFFGRFHWNSARVSYVALVNRRFFDHEASGYIPRNKWSRKRRFLPRCTGWMPKCNKRIVVRTVQNGFVPQRHAPSKWTVVFDCSKIERDCRSTTSLSSKVAPAPRQSVPRWKTLEEEILSRSGFSSGLRSSALTEFETRMYLE